MMNPRITGELPTAAQALVHLIVPTSVGRGRCACGCAFEDVWQAAELATLADPAAADWDSWRGLAICVDCIRTLEMGTTFE